MGLLDDAIREHLELKKRRGADVAEVARQEQEAFGPPRRGDFEVARAAEPEDHHGGGPGPALDEPATTYAEPAPPPLHIVEDPHPVQDEPPRPHGDRADHLPHLAPPEPGPLHDHQPAPQHEPPRPQGDPADKLPHVEQPTQAFDADEIRAATTPPPARPPEAPAAPTPESEPSGPEAPAPAPEPTPERPAPPEPPRAEEEPAEDDEPEDVLEETPEFLQETPEHDRLWFEQRPPRDFDF